MSTKQKNTEDGFIFQTKKDLEFYVRLKALQESHLIHSFALGEFVDDKSKVTKYRAKEINIDGLRFPTKSDAEFYLQLAEHKSTGFIQQFSFDHLQKNGQEKTKFASKKVEIDHHLFDSKSEAKFYLHLLEKKYSGGIRDFSLQPVFELQPAFHKYGKNFRKIEYIADFEVYHLDGQIEVIDVKGMITPDFSLKKKLFDFKYMDKSLVLMKEVEKYGGWISMDDWKERKKTDKKKKS